MGDHGDDVNAVAVTASGGVVSAGDDGRLLLWDPSRPGAAPIELGRARARLLAAATVAGGRLVTGDETGRLAVWDPGGTADAVAVGSHGDRVLAVGGLPDGRVVSGGADGRLLLWDPRRYESGSASVQAAHQAGGESSLSGQGEPVELAWRGGAVRGVAVLPDGHVISGGEDGVLCRWNPDEPNAGSPQVVSPYSSMLVFTTTPAPGQKQADSVLGQHEKGIWALAVLSEGRVVTGGYDGRLLLWEASTAGMTSRQVDAHDGVVYTVAALPDGRIASGSADRSVRLANPVGTDPPTDLGCHDGWVMSVAGLADGRVVSGGRDGKVRVWDPAAGAPSRAPSQDRTIGTLTGTPSGRLVAGDSEGRLFVWWSTRRVFELPTVGGHTDWIRAIVALDDGRVISAGDDGRILRWDPELPQSGPEVIAESDGGRIAALGLLPDGRILSGDDLGRLRIWENQIGSSPRSLGLQRGSVRAIAVLDNSRAVSAAAGQMQLWDLSGGRTAFGDKGIWTLCALPAGRLASGDADGRVKVWDLTRPGAEPIELPGHRGFVREIVSLPGGRILTGGSHDQLRLSDIGTGSEVAGAACSVIAMAVVPSIEQETIVAISHAGHGLTQWQVLG